MTKSLKGLPGRAYNTSTTEEFIGGRQLAGIVQPVTVVQPVASLDSRADVAARESRGLPATLTFGKAGAIETSGDSLTMLPCCLSCGKNTASVHEHGFESTLGGRDNGLTIPTSIMDEGTLTVTVGGSVSGVIDTTGDTDLITVDLVAGQTYLISLVGSGANPITDSFLTVNAPGGALINQDDDGGVGLYSLITITAAVSGTYEIVAASFNNPGDPGTGDYTVTVQQQGADEAPTIPPPDVPHTIGTTTYGFINPAGDGDIYQVTLTEGFIYSFEVAAGADYNTDWQAVPTGEVDTIIQIFDANGVLVASNDDIAFPDDISSAAGFLAEEGGTYYVRVSGYPGQTGGYTLVSEEIDIGDLDPLDAINWFSADNVDFVDVAGVPTAYVYFATAGQNFGETQGDGPGALVSLGWNATEMAAVMQALEQYEHILGVNYEITTDVNQATFRLITTEDEPYGAYFYPQDPDYGTQQGIGVFNTDNGAWSIAGQPGLVQGGFDFGVILHEFGHAHGLAHPHDNGGGSDVMLGVTGAIGSYGIYDLNQGVYTVMSYNDAWDFHPDGGTPFTVAHANSGWSGTLGAFDIAVLQLRYGVHAYNETDTVYALTDDDEAAFYQTIWDSGGTDAIAYGGAGDATIDLTAATLDYSPTGAGVLSFVNVAGAGIWGGYTIANTVVIENATSGSGDDTLIGNSAANVLTANDGTDIMIGREGDDTLDGGAGADTAVFGGNIADYTITDIGGGSYTVTDNNTADGDDGTDTVIGAEFLQFADATFTIDPDPNTNEAPTLAGLIPALVFGENTVNATPQIIDGDVDFQDEDGNFDGGTLTVSGLLAEDVVGIRDEGEDAGEIGVDGSDVTYGGIAIGSFTGGNGTTLTVTFNAAATAPAIDALIENLTYANTSENPTPNRTLTLDVVDDEGASLVIIPTAEGGYVELTGGDDPLAGLPAFGAGPNLAFVDVNNDGDLDVVVGDQPGTLRYFENNGAGYTEMTAGSNPFNGFVVGTYSTPAAMDFDGDGDLDLIVGANTGNLHAWQNNGNGTWTNLVGAGVNPFHGMDAWTFSDPTAIDLDGDGDVDALAGTSFGDFYAVINNGGGSFTLHDPYTATNPFAGVVLSGFSSAAAGDVDGDGDDDVVVGVDDGTIVTFINEGGGTFTEAVGTTNPFDGIDVGAYALPVLVDIDGDGDDDLVVADSAGGDTRVFENSTIVMDSNEIDITVLPQNDAPSGTDNEITVYEDGSHTFSAAEFGFSDVEGDAFAAVVISSLPAQGALTLNNVAVTNGQVISTADITAGLLVFTPDPDESGPNYASFTFSVQDDGGTDNGGSDTDPTPNTMAIAVLPDNSPPRLSDVVDSVTYDENVVNTTPQILDLDVTFDDPDDNFAGGTVTVTGLLAEDVVSVNNEGTGAGQIGVSGTDVTYGGVVIGTISGGNGTTFTVTLNGDADSESVEALIENLTYANTSDQPTADRTLTINVTDADGADLAFQSEFEFLAGDDPFLGLTNGGSYSTPTLLDVDGDGDTDMVSGGNTGAIFFYRNNGSNEFAEAPGSQNPFNGIDIGAFSATTAIDIDNDGDLDLVAGNGAGTLATFLNNNGNATWTQLTGAANPFNLIDVGSYSAPAGGDIDGDGDMDLIVGELDGTINTFSNNGNGTFTALTGANNPFQGVTVDYLANPSLFDIDGDGDLDALIGNYYGGIYAFNNGGVFTVADPDTNPFDGVFVGPGPALGFGDIDGDGDLDAVIGSRYGDFLSFENVTPTSVSIEVNVTAQVDIVELYDGNGDLVETYSTIQRAIDAALDGYRIVAPAGTYAEDLVIDVDVTIEGANAGVAGTGVRGAETIIDGGLLVTANGVTIDGVQISGSITGPGTPPFDSGIYLQGDDFSLINSVLDGPDSAAGILTELTLNLDVGHNLIQGYAIGLYISSGGSTGSVHDNLFQGDGGPLTGLGNGVNSETSGVLITNNTFDGLYSGSLNLFPFGPNPVDLNTYVIGNTITNSGPARPVQIFPTADSTDFIGTDHDESFRGDAGVGGVALSYEGRGGNDHAFGGTENDTFSGDAGSDQLFGGDGDDLLTGGADNDLLDGEGGIDTAVFADANLLYTDTVVGWLVSSSEGSDFVQRTEIVEADGQRNLLVGSTGFAGIQAAFDSAEIGDIVRLASGTYTGSWTYDDAGLVVIAQPNARINGTFTTAGSDGITIFGANLADTITTGAGNDRLHGGAGNDTMAGGAGDDWYFVDGGDTVVEGALEGTGDRVFAGTSYTLSAGAHVEILSTTSHAGTAAIDLGGNELNNLIYGNAGDNRIDGHGGADVMVGFGGNDWYYVDHAGDRVVEGASEGTGDRVFASASYTLNAGAHIEIMSTSFHAGTAAIDLGGNELGNLIYGNAGSNVLDGKGGSDTLIGNGGADTFAFTTALGAGNVDILAGFGADDTIALDDAVFTGLGLGALDPNAFVTGTAAQDGDDRIVYDQATGRLYYDADGNGAGAAVQFATLAGAPIISASDFQVI